jgi:hypothetical protein
MKKLIDIPAVVLLALAALLAAPAALLVSPAAMAS